MVHIHFRITSPFEKLMKVLDSLSLSLPLSPDGVEKIMCSCPRHFAYSFWGFLGLLPILPFLRDPRL